MGQGEVMRRFLDEVTAVHQANFPECPLPQVVCREIWLPGFQNTDNSFEALVNAVDCEHVITDAAHDLSATYKIPISLKYGARRNIFRLMNLCASIYAIYQNNNYKCHFFNAMILPVQPANETLHIYIGQLFGVPFLKKFHKLIRAKSDTLVTKERRNRLQMINLLNKIFLQSTNDEVTSVVHSWFNHYSSAEEEKIEYRFSELNALVFADKLNSMSIYGTNGANLEHSGAYQSLPSLK